MIGLYVSSHLTAVIPLAMSNIYIVHCWRRIACEWGLETADNEWVSLVLSSVPCRMYITFICILPQYTYIVFYMQYKMYILFQFQYAFFHISLHCQRSSTDRLWSLNFMKRNIKTEIQFSGCWLILSVYIIMSFDFPFVRLLGVR
jgi:hypothetical protein